MRPRYSLAKRMAKHLLRKARISEPPVPVERLAALAEASIKYEPFAGELSGMAYRLDDGKAIIGVNSLHAATRKRFTIAHEIAHLLLHDSEEFHIDERFPIGLRDGTSSLAVDPAEIEANQFAAEILMPEAWLLAEIRGQDLDFESEEVIDALAKKYGVSVQSMSFRLNTLAAKE